MALVWNAPVRVAPRRAVPYFTFPVGWGKITNAVDAKQNFDAWVARVHDEQCKCGGWNGYDPSRNAGPCYKVVTVADGTNVSRSGVNCEIVNDAVYNWVVDQYKATLQRIFALSGPPSKLQWNPLGQLPGEGLPDFPSVPSFPQDASISTGSKDCWPAPDTEKYRGSATLLTLFGGEDAKTHGWVAQAFEWNGSAWALVDSYADWTPTTGRPNAQTWNDYKDKWLKANHVVYRWDGPLDPEPRMYRFAGPGLTMRDDCTTPAPPPEDTQVPPSASASSSSSGGIGAGTVLATLVVVGVVILVIKSAT